MLGRYVGRSVILPYGVYSTDWQRRYVLGMCYGSAVLLRGKVTSRGKTQATIDSPVSKTGVDSQWWPYCQWRARDAEEVWI